MQFQVVPRERVEVIVSNAIEGEVKTESGTYVR